jgi:hypothetical protein
MAEEETDADSRDKWSAFHFSLSNPAGPGQGDVARLLRITADHLEALGDVQVADIVFSSEPTADEDDLRFTIYYYREPRRRSLH